MVDERKEIPLHRERLGLLDKDAQTKLVERKRKQLTQDMALVFNSEEGRRVLRYILNLGGFKKGKIGGNPQLGMDVLEGTLYNCAREQILLEILEFVPAYILKDCEYGIFDDLI